ncbi:MAG: hypothetical protein SGI98_03810 [Verrucomicrobiota bacterium]|nr:hypothetical protein [Verrucomicrobiota bacterium]
MGTIATVGMPVLSSSPIHRVTQEILVAPEFIQDKPFYSFLFIIR